jgi:hypothetical protein
MDGVHDRNTPQLWNSRLPRPTLRLEILTRRFHRHAGHLTGHVEDGLPNLILAHEPHPKTPGIRLSSVEPVPDHLDGRVSNEDTCVSGDTLDGI